MCALVTGVQTCALPILAEVAKVEENAASGSYRGRGLVTSPSARIVVVSRGRSRREIAPRLAIITHPDFAIVRDRKRVVSGKSVSVRVDLGVSRILKNTSYRRDATNTP